MKNHSLLFFGIFICSLVVGYTFSTRFYPSDFNLLSGSLKVVSASNQRPINTMSNGQRSILLISTSSLSSLHPHLESVWLATYFPTDTFIRLLPIFPAGDQTISELESQLVNSFNFKKANGRLNVNQNFLDILAAENYWWSGYIVLDNVAMAQTFDLLGGIELKGQKLTGEQVLSELPDVQDDPSNAYSYQIAILQSACKQFAQLATKLDLSDANFLLPRHLITDLEPEQIKQEIQSFTASGREPTCKFPLLEQSQIVH